MPPMSPCLGVAQPPSAGAEKACKLLMMGWSVLGILSLYAQESAGETIDVVLLKRQIDGVRVLNDRLQAAPEERRRQTARLNADECQKLELGPTSPGFAFVEYFRSRQLLITGDSGQAEATPKKLVSIRSIGPEAVLLIMETMASDRKARTSFERLLAGILPLSVWRRQSDAADSYDPNAVMYLSDPVAKGAPDIPTYDSAKLLEIADDLLELRLFQRAADAYPEAIYQRFVPPWVAGPSMSEKWLSSEAAPYWLKGAECEWRIGHKMTAVDYVAKAAVYGNQSQYEQATILLNRWSGPQPASPEAGEPNATQLADGLERVAHLYAELNLHPRAVELVDVYASTFGASRAGALKTELSQQWLSLLDRYCVGKTGKVILFGIDVLPKNNRLKVKIPQPLSEEALKAAAQFFKE
jgi:hypothetical protein